MQIRLREYTTKILTLRSKGNSSGIRELNPEEQSNMQEAMKNKGTGTYVDRSLGFIKER